jgi:hypothetical protein
MRGKDNSSQRRTLKALIVRCVSYVGYFGDLSSAQVALKSLLKSASYIVCIKPEYMKWYCELFLQSYLNIYSSVWARDSAKGYRTT